MAYKVKNWERFQHFRDRKPPWIKLYRDLLDQRDINMISDCSFRVLVYCWLIASEDNTGEGRLPCVDDIAFRCRLDNKLVARALGELRSWIHQDDIKMISPGYQLDAPETETETETETENADNSFLNLAKTSRRKGKRVKPDEVMIRIGAWFSRRPETLWSQAEAMALKDAKPTAAEIDVIEKYYTAQHKTDADFRRRNIITLLNNWPSEVDKAERFASQPPAKKLLEI